MSQTCYRHTFMTIIMHMYVYVYYLQMVLIGDGTHTDCMYRTEYWNIHYINGG